MAWGDAMNPNRIRICTLASVLVDACGVYARRARLAFLFL
jgi:hypothetical protein